MGVLDWIFGTREDNEDAYARRLDEAASRDPTLDDVPPWSRPMFSSTMDQYTGVYDELGRKQYRTPTGQTYFLDWNPDQRTRRMILEDDVIPVVQDYIENPTLPTASQIGNFAVDVAKESFDTLADTVRGQGTIGDVLGIATGVGGAGLSVSRNAADDAVGMFLNGRARGVDLDARNRATGMSAKGVDRDTIWKDTGWGKFSGEWITEIDDSMSEIKAQAPYKERGTETIYITVPGGLSQQERVSLRVDAQRKVLEIRQQLERGEITQEQAARQAKQIQNELEMNLLDAAAPTTKAVEVNRSAPPLEYKGRLDEVLFHDSLFDAIPDSANMPTAEAARRTANSGGESSNLRGVYYPQINSDNLLEKKDRSRISAFRPAGISKAPAQLSKSQADEVWSTALHETQHFMDDVTQSSSGRGSNPQESAEIGARAAAALYEAKKAIEATPELETVRQSLAVLLPASENISGVTISPDLAYDYLEQVHRAALNPDPDKAAESLRMFVENVNPSNSGDKIEEVLKYITSPDDNIASVIDKISQLKNSKAYRLSFMSDFDLYQHEGGEVKSRLTQHRRNLTAEQRRERPFWHDLPEVGVDERNIYSRQSPNLNVPLGSIERPDVYYHGTDADPFEVFDPAYLRRTRQSPNLRSPESPVGVASFGGNLFANGFSDPSDETLDVLRSRFPNMEARDEMYRVGERQNARGGVDVRIGPEKPLEEVPLYPADPERKSVFIDPELARVEYDGELYNKIIPTRGAPRLDDLIEPSDSVIYRGMSAEEYRSAIDQGFIKSKGDYNIGPEQEGLTFFSSRPSQAESYANNYTPEGYRATPDRPAYVVGIRRPKEFDYVVGETEIGLRGEIPTSRIVEVYEGRPYVFKGDVGIMDDWGTTRTYGAPDVAEVTWERKQIPSDFGYTQDKPGGTWLQRQQERAEQEIIDNAEGRFGRGTTGSIERPDVYYHGTDAAPFEVFDPAYNRTAKHIYLTPNSQDASAYGKNVLEFEARGLVADMRPGGRYRDAVVEDGRNAFQAAFEDHGLDDYFDSLEDFIDAFDAGDMYQRFGSQRVQNDVIDALLDVLNVDALRIPDAGFGGRMSESIVYQNPAYLRRVTEPSSASDSDGFAAVENAPASLGYRSSSNIDELVLDADTNALDVLGIDPAMKDEWRGINKVDQKQRRIPQIEDAAKALLEGSITSAEYRELVQSFHPIVPFSSVPNLPTVEEIASALDNNKVAKGIIGVNKGIENGTYVSSRLDIPAYENYDTWVVSLHDGTGDSLGGKSIGYAQTAVLKDVKFGTVPKAAVNIASGKPKTTIARIFGSWENADPESVYALAQQYINDPEWVQVGMNPFRHSYFYDKVTGEPVIEATEVIQVGPLVLARGVRKASPDDPMFRIDPKNTNSRTFSRGGLVTSLGCA